MSYVSREIHTRPCCCTVCTTYCCNCPTAWRIRLLGVSTKGWNAISQAIDVCGSIWTIVTLPSLRLSGLWYIHLWAKTLAVRQGNKDPGGLWSYTGNGAQLRWSSTAKKTSNRT